MTAKEDAAQVGTPGPGRPGGGEAGTGRNRLRLLLGLVVLVVAVVAVVLLTRPQLVHTSSWVTGTRDLDAPDNQLVYTDADGGGVVAVYTFRNDGLLPVTVRAGETDDGGTTEMVAHPRDPEATFDPANAAVVPSVTVPRGREVGVRIDLEFPECMAFGPGSGVVKDHVELRVDTAGFPRSAVVPLDNELHLRTVDGRPAADGCNGTAHVG